MPPVNQATSPCSSKKSQTRVRLSRSPFRAGSDGVRIRIAKSVVFWFLHSPYSIVVDLLTVFGVLLFTSLCWLMLVVLQISIDVGHVPVSPFSVLKFYFKVGNSIHKWWHTHIYKDNLWIYLQHSTTVQTSYIRCSTVDYEIMISFNC